MKFNINQDQKDLRNFQRKMRKLKRFGKEGFITVAQNAAAMATKLAQSRVPVRTGDLKRSIHAKRDGDSVFIAAEMDYAGFVEFGTKRQKPKPYFYNSIRDALKKVTSDMDKEFNKYKR